MINNISKSTLRTSETQVTTHEQFLFGLEILRNATLAIKLR